MGRSNKIIRFQVIVYQTDLQQRIIAPSNAATTPVSSRCLTRLSIGRGPDKDRTRGGPPAVARAYGARTDRIPSRVEGDL